jgi:hypothetical protein
MEYVFIVEVEAQNVKSNRYDQSFRLVPNYSKDIAGVYRSKAAAVERMENLILSFDWDRVAVIQEGGEEVAKAFFTDSNFSDNGKINREYTIRILKMPVL